LADRGPRRGTTKDLQQHMTGQTVFRAQVTQGASSQDAPGTSVAARRANEVGELDDAAIAKAVGPSIPCDFVRSDAPDRTGYAMST
jgi:hypothetical protein